MAALPQSPLRPQEEQALIAEQEISLLLLAFTALPSPMQTVAPLRPPLPLPNLPPSWLLHRQRRFSAMAALPQSPLQPQVAQALIAEQEISLLLLALTALPSPMQTVAPLPPLFPFPNLPPSWLLHRHRRFSAMAALPQS